MNGPLVSNRGDVNKIEKKIRVRVPKYTAGIIPTSPQPSVPYENPRQNPKNSTGNRRTKVLPSIGLQKPAKSTN